MLASGRMPLGASPTKGENSSTPFVLSNKEVAYVGEPIVLVVAKSRYLAEDAAALVQLELTPLPVVCDARAAMEAGSPVVRTELKSNVLNAFNVGYRRGRGGLRQGRACLLRRLLAAPRLRPFDGRARRSRRDPAGQTGCASGRRRRCRMMSTTCSPPCSASTRTRCASSRRMSAAGSARNTASIRKRPRSPPATLLLKRTLKWVEDRRETFISSIQERDQYWSVGGRHRR